MFKHMAHYKLSGQVEISSKYDEKDLPEIKARSVVIIVSHLFYDKQEWEALRPYVASALYPDNIYWMENRADDIEYNIDACLAKKPATSYMDSTVNGGFELLVSGKYFVKVTYWIKLLARTDYCSGMAREHKTEPNFVWTNSFKKLDDAINNVQEPFSANAVDAVVAADIQKTPIVYLQ